MIRLDHVYCVHVVAVTLCVVFREAAVLGYGSPAIFGGGGPSVTVVQSNLMHH